MDYNGSGPRGNSDSLNHEEEIVIVGGGIGGLACALALHRVGIKAVILEQSETLRVEGAAIALWTNAFCVLDVLGVGEKFRTMFTNLLKKEILNSRGKTLTKVELADCDGGRHQLRVVERNVLLEVLAEELPEGTIHFNSRVVRIRKSETRTGITDVELESGSTYSAKVVIGFDGINSCVASWMGLQKAQPVGNVVIRGMANFPGGHTFENKVQFFVGKGTHTAILPSSSTKVFWSLVWNDWSEGWRNTSGEQRKAEALQRASTSFSSTPMPFLINNTPPERFFKSTIRQRLNPDPDVLVNGNVTVAGDAAHPITPDMAQGGCMALEDAVIITQKLYWALRSTPNADDQVQNQVQLTEHERINQALLEFHRERHERISFISTQSIKIGKLMLSGWSVINFFRDRFVIPVVVNKTSSLAHTMFDVGKLPTSTSS
ncbi:hypothetical protein KC19_6G113200 [Ceratodon purpureus]|uniref:FAD-binding domain-containing protein n=1 Tax=Ceratodon purpureus TaxID=3225 RepID=A0A8T0HH90_CERPU|nr:hypothetical protein KC19_6G113200 [Ceratodon purpureus]